jgi:chemotaxis protein CheC
VVLLTDDDRGATDMDAIKVGTLTEVGNIVLNGVMGAIGNELQQRVYYSVPFYLEDPLGILLAGEALENKSDVIWIQTQFTVQEHQVEGDIVILFSAGSLEMLITAIDRVLEK